jgi:hypothetical protein
MDYKIVELETQQLLIKNEGELVSPIVISGITGDSIFFEKWVDGFEGQKWIEIPAGNYAEIKIDPGHITPESYRLNNNIKKTGIFPRSDPVRPQIFFSVEDPEKRGKHRFDTVRSLAVPPLGVDFEVVEPLYLTGEVVAAPIFSPNIKAVSANNSDRQLPVLMQLGLDIMSSHRPTNAKEVPQPMIYEIINNLPFRIGVDVVALNNTEILYNELHSNTSKYAMLEWTDVSCIVKFA